MITERRNMKESGILKNGEARPGRIARGLLVMAIIIFAGISAMAAEKDEAKEADMDPKLYSYLMECRRFPDNPRIMERYDTLYDMAGKLGDTRAQAVALCEKAIHFYNFKDTPANRDSLQKYVDIVKKFAKETDQPKYYYWIGMRHAEYFLKNREFQHSLVMLDKMLHEAMAENYQKGVADVYKVIARAYFERKNYQLAEENQRQALKIVTQLGDEDYNLSNAYGRLAAFQMAQRKFDEAKISLQRADSTAKNDRQLADNAGQWVRYYKHENNIGKMREMYETQKRLAPENINSIKVSELSISDMTGDYKRSLELIEELYAAGKHSREDYLRGLAQTYAQMGGHDKEALGYYASYVACRDSLFDQDASRTVEEFNALLNVRDKEMEQKEMELRMQNDKNKSLLIITGACAILVIVMLILLLRTLHNRRLGV